jgi:hypothetical protein
MTAIPAIWLIRVRPRKSAVSFLPIPAMTAIPRDDGYPFTAP